MKVLKYITIAGLALTLSVFTACEKDPVPSVDDLPINYDIPTHIDLTADIPVGAFLVNPNSAFSDLIRYERLTQPYEVTTGKVGPNIRPAQGNYDFGRADTASARAYQNLVEYAKIAKLDFFITNPVRERAGLYPHNIDVNDSSMVQLIAGQIDTLPRPDMGSLKYAITLDLEQFSAGLNNNTLIEKVDSSRYKTPDGRDTAVAREDRLYAFVKNISNFFQHPTYYHTAGRPLLVLKGGHKLYCENARRVYDNIRAAIKEQSGKDVYLLAIQEHWSPAARWHYFFLSGKVDAVTMQNMCNLAADFDKTTMTNHFINENFKYNRQYLSSHYGIDFIPTASTSYSEYVLNANYKYPIVFRNEDEFRRRCVIAKWNLGSNPMVLIDSFNRWETDSQIEPAEVGYGNGYGNKYLEIVAEQFKVR